MNGQVKNAKFRGFTSLSLGLIVLNLKFTLSFLLLSLDEANHCQGIEHKGRCRALLLLVRMSKAIQGGYFLPF